ncbi:fructose-1,6-bisphosphatase [Campylobacter sputorum subsp. bubulus]|uniref:Fructose-1,6-bisphosphatase class 1 n=1 Tax=Campylobacter sputorum subsp. sputorum TaxID=32024 RepID=A0A381DI33_9BACT|nr:class 1 fructose-bisphosphatase [Campylobacter sputorum]ASM35381.1 fructose-1,6-bisphosphatase I [Campylobacter sputorum aubsp. sputorum RM3237]KAB0582875.1 class 1 fructose-bisphosphatase [Campylobacter sputorum subsp. sputorum]QEL05573.1 fructose-1,6-bisphosphatase I [Campylobacter sputorum subsp. sputorum]SUX08606.1 fructose-1,6-bisphosphatase [Campylobacter sputorum subsp. bubulus]SUX10338.1 fructose-1,6-bisphosphatase [Campylobacter sputorum subsp. sputorum]
MQEIFETIKKAAIRISDALKYSDLGYTHNQNSTGDTQLKLDVMSDNIITEEFSKINVKALVSEEKDEALTLNEDGKFIVAYDPLDGSSLVDVNFAVGSIFGIYENEISPKTLKAAAYTIYGPRLELVIASDKVRLYRLDRNNEFVFIKDLLLSQKGKLNATGATQKGWSDTHRNFIKSLFDEGYRLRYSGAMVSDLHQILLKGGGLFSYPSTSDTSNGKLRLTFEVLPFAFIYEKAGGKTSDGKNDSLLNLEVLAIHQTTPCFFGSSYEINKMHEYYGK